MKKKSIHEWQSDFSKNNKELRVTIQEYRVLQLEELILNGIYKPSKAKIYANEFGISERQFYKYVKIAYEKIKQSNNLDISYEKSLMLQRLENHYAINLKAENYTECRLILKERANILGLYEPVKTEVTSEKKEKNVLVDKYMNIIKKVEEIS